MGIIRLDFHPKQSGTDPVPTQLMLPRFARTAGLCAVRGMGSSAPNQVETDMALTDKTKPTNKPRKRPRREAIPTMTPSKPLVTKRDRLIAHLEHADGASVQQLQTEFCWQAHTVRAAISGLRKAGFDVQRGADEHSSVYRIVALRAT